VKIFAIVETNGWSNGTVISLMSKSTSASNRTTNKGSQRPTKENDSLGDELLKLLGETPVDGDCEITDTELDDELAAIMDNANCRAVPAEDTSDELKALMARFA
jgi:hypothetical protein